jgi:hypothetical protein
MEYDISFFVLELIVNVLVVEDIIWHQKMCQYANYPHNNILPNLPPRKKSASNDKSHLKNRSATAEVYSN